MSILFQMLTLTVCLQTAWPYPIHDDESSLLDMQLAERPFYPYKDTLLSPLGLLDIPRETPGQRKKAVDSTFIRFGRSSSGESGSEKTTDNYPSPSTLLDDNSKTLQQGDTFAELSVGLPQRFFLNHNGCRVSSTQELRKALLMDPNCIRAFQKTKKENINDTFIRFGKREAPSEKEFKSSNEAR